MTFDKFKEKIDRDLYPHPVIQNNPYTKWFKLGLANDEQVKDLITQFSVFSLHFVYIEAKRGAFANNIKSEIASWELVASELGSGINIATGSVDGQKIYRKNSHIEWLRSMGAELGLDQEMLGHWYLANAHTKKFLRELEKAYASEDGNIGSGASFAIENWAAFGIGGGQEAESNNFWKELITGMEIYNQNNRVAKEFSPLDITFFTHHFALENCHRNSVVNELKEIFDEKNFNGREWFYGARRALDAIYIFWQGLDEARSR